MSSFIQLCRCGGAFCLHLNLTVPLTIVSVSVQKQMSLIQCLFDFASRAFSYLFTRFLYKRPTAQSGDAPAENKQPFLLLWVTSHNSH